MIKIKCKIRIPMDEITWLVKEVEIEISDEEILKLSKRINSVKEVG